MHQWENEKLQPQEQETQPNQEKYVPRPKWQLALAWIAVGVVVFAFLGTIYWMMNFRL